MKNKVRVVSGDPEPSFGYAAMVLERRVTSCDTLMDSISFLLSLSLLLGYLYITAR